MALSRSEGRRVFLQLVRKPMVVLGALVILAWVAVSVAAPLLSSFDPTEVDVDNRLGAPSAEHWLGVDGLGRDVFTRVLYGGRVSLPVAAVVVVVASIFGTLYGALAGYFGGWFDEVTMRIVDMVLAFPSLILAMAIAAALGPSIQNSMLALLVVWWPPYARLARGQVLALKARDFVSAAAALGLRDRRILLRHVLPNGRALDRPDGHGLRQRDHHHCRAVLPRPGRGAAHARVGRHGGGGPRADRPVVDLDLPRPRDLHGGAGRNFVGDGLRDAIDPKLRLR